MVLQQGGNLSRQVLLLNILDLFWMPFLSTVYTLFKGNKNATLLPLELKTGKTSFSVEHKGQVWNVIS